MSLRMALIKRAAKLPVEEAFPHGFQEAVSSGGVLPEQVPHMLNAYRDRVLASAVRTYKLDEAQAQELSAELTQALKKYQMPLEGAAFKATSGAGAPVTPLELGVTGVAAAGLPWAWGKIKGDKATTLASSVKQVPGLFGPAFMPVTAGMGAAMTFLNPLRDPRVRRGDHSYWKSWKEAIDAEADSLNTAGRTAYNRYGVMGVPVQMLHGIMNPVSSIYGLGRAVGKRIGVVGDGNQ